MNLRFLNYGDLKPENKIFSKLNQKPFCLSLSENARAIREGITKVWGSKIRREESGQGEVEKEEGKKDRRKVQF